MPLADSLLTQQATLQHAIKSANTTADKIASLRQPKTVNEQLRALLKSKQA